jgi:phosphatidylserine/phosphatidylglycerophosphate/cardiolipin synthase-like enzyme
LLIAERTRDQRAPLELVWSGPLSPAPQTRDTAVVLAEMFAASTKRVLLAGYVFTHGGSILRPLHVALERGVSVRFFMDIPGQASTVADIPGYAKGQVEEFLGRNWPFGPPFPTFFYDPRTASPLERAILHAKCAVVDGRRALVTSANFTNAAQTRNIEVGVLIDDEIFATRLEGQFNALVTQGALVEVPAR